MEKRIKYSGIYKIENLINGKIYIGQTGNLYEREYQHFYELRKGAHGSNHLQNSFNKYGEENFIFKVILYCEVSELTYYEQKCVDIFNPEYNKRLICVDSNLGIKMPECFGKWQSEFRRGENHPSFGKPRSEETKKKISESNKGRKVSQETRNKISKSLMGEKNFNYGKKFSEETIKRMSEAQIGRKASEETKKNMSIAQTGKKHTKEQTEKIAKANIGKKRTDESKLKISISKTLDKNVVLEIKKLLDSGMMPTEIGRKLNVDRGTVYKVKNGGYKDIYGI